MGDLDSSSEMTQTPPHSARNPFDDNANRAPSSTMQHTADSSPRRSVEQKLVLTVDRNTTLTIGTDSLIVLDEGLKYRREKRNCFGLLPQLSKTTHAIPFRNILWAELEDLSVTIKYAKPVGRGGRSCKVGNVHYMLTDKTALSEAKRWVETLLDRAYPADVKRRKRIKVLINPFGGQGYAQSIWSRQVEPILAAAQCKLDVEKTAYRGHAVDIAKALDADAYDVIASASGDGLPHETLNGLAKQKNPLRALRNVAVVQIPCGSGNAMSLNLLGASVPSWAALEIVKGVPMPLDLVAITQGDKKYYSFLSQAVGIVAESDLGTESLRWMGSFRFTWGVLIRIFGKTIYPAEISIATETKDKEEIKRQYRSALQERHSSDRPLAGRLSSDSQPGLPDLRFGTVNDTLPAEFETVDYPNLGNFYVGNMPFMAADVQFFPMSLPNDGLLDLVIVPGDTSRLTALKMLATIESGGVIDYAEVDYRKVLGYRITPRREGGVFAADRGLRSKLIQWLGGAGDQTEGLIAIDGERVPFEPFQAEVQQGLATALSRSGVSYEIRPAGY